MALALRGNSRAPERRVVKHTARLADRVLERVRGLVGVELDRLHVSLRRMEARNDPGTHQWMNEMRKSIADGSVWEELDSQPDLQVILDEYRKQLT